MLQTEGVYYITGQAMKIVFHVSQFADFEFSFLSKTFKSTIETATANKMWNQSKD
jgi:hypothetical protein